MSEREWVSKLASSSMWMLVGILLGRLAGFFREIVLATRFGVGSEADMAILMLTLPDMMVNILVGGGLSVALIPAFKRYGAGPRAHCLFVQSSMIVFLLFSLVALLLTTITVPLIHLVAPGFSAHQVMLTAPLLEVVLWLIPLTTIAGVTTAYLQANGRFAVAAFGTFSFNAVILLGLGFSIATNGSLKSLALFILLGGLFRWSIQLWAAPRHHLAWRCSHWRLIDRQLIKRYLNAMTAGGLLLLLPVMARALASLHGAGGISLFSYAMKLVEFPLSISVMVLSAGIFPLLSQCFVRNEEDCGEIVGTGIHVVLLITVAMVLPLSWYAGDIAHLVFARGAMEPGQVTIIGRLVALGVLALPLQGIASILTATYNAANDTAFIMKLNIVGVVLYLTIGYWSISHIGLSALMVSLVAVYGIIVLMQLLALRKRLSLNIMETLWHKKIVRSLIMMLLAGAGLLLLMQSLRLGVSMNVAAAVMIGACMLLVGIVTGGSQKALFSLLVKRASQ